MNPKTSESLSIFKDGKLKPGFYKIQNLHSQTYMDVEERSREVCCRPVTTLEEGRGLVRPFWVSVTRVSDDYKWEIKPLGPGYSVQRVSVPNCCARYSESAAACLTTMNPG